MGFAIQHGYFADDMYGFTNMTPTAEDLAFIDAASPLSADRSNVSQPHFFFLQDDVTETDA